MATAIFLPEAELETMCIKVAACPILFKKLDNYEKEELRYFALSKAAEFQKCSEAERQYYRLINPLRDAVETVLALFKSDKTGVAAAQNAEQSDMHADHLAGILSKGFTISALDKILFSIGLLEDAESHTATKEPKPQVWVAVIEALTNRKLLNASKKDIAQAFISRYGEIGAVRSLQRPYQPNNVYARHAFERTYELAS